MRLLIVSETTPAVVEYCQTFTDAGESVESLTCLLCPWEPRPGWTTEDAVNKGQVHADQPHWPPFPAMVEKPDTRDASGMRVNSTGSLFGYDMADMIDRGEYEPAGNITDETVTAVAPIIAALLQGEVRRAEREDER